MFVNRFFFLKYYQEKSKKNSEKKDYKKRQEKSVHHTLNYNPSGYPSSYQRYDDGLLIYNQSFPEFLSSLSSLLCVKFLAESHEQPVVPPQVSHFKHVPLRTRVKCPHSGQGSPS